MKLGLVVDGPGSFVRELMADFQSHYETRVFNFAERRWPFFHSRINRWNLRRSLSKFLRDNDVVFFEWAGPLLVVASHLKVPGRIVVRLHSYELFEYAPRIRWESVERVLLVSRAMQQHFSERYPEAAGKSAVINNGVDLQRFHSSERRYSGVMGMVATLIPIKRIYEVILALYELNRTGICLELRIAGPRDQGADADRYYLAMQRAVRQLGLEGQVSFVGAVADPSEFLRGLDIFISNSYWEGQQVALLEAMASGCYCLSHFWDGVVQVLPEDYVFVTDGELRQKISDYCAMPEPVQRQHREKMRAIACEKFDIEQTKTQIRAVLENGRPGITQ